MMKLASVNKLNKLKEKFITFWNTDEYSTSRQYFGYFANIFFKVNFCILRSQINERGTFATTRTMNKYRFAYLT